MADLKPCPFCGDTPRNTKLRINCSCGASHNPSDWNTRPAPKLPEGYRVEVPYQGRIELRWGSNGVFVCALDGDTIVFKRFTDNSHGPALIAFLQGAR